MASKTDEELETYLIDIKKYSAAEVKTALAEQQKRGKVYNQLQLNYIQQIILRKVVTEDPNTPVLYAKETIFIFSFLCSVLFGSILRPKGQVGCYWFWNNLYRFYGNYRRKSSYWHGFYSDSLKRYWRSGITNLFLEQIYRQKCGV